MKLREDVRRDLAAGYPIELILGKKARDFSPLWLESKVSRTFSILTTVRKGIGYAHDGNANHHATGLPALRPHLGAAH